jgi:cobalt-zinc-cadmium efflux system outer membrane protein
MTANCRRPLIATLGAVSAALGVHAACAEPAPPYLELLKQAEATAPRLAQSRAEVRQAAGLAEQASALPNPTLGLSVENFGGSAAFNAISPTQTTVSVSQPLELGGKRSARSEAGRAGLDAARALATQAKAEYAFDLAQAYIAAEAGDRRLQLAEDALAMAQDDARAADALVRAGREADVRNVQARAAVESARAALASVRTVRETAFAKLTALSGFPRPLTSIPDGLLAHGDVIEARRQIDALATPAYLAARAARDATARRVRLEQTRGMPDLTASVGLRQLSGISGGALVAGLSAPLPLFDRNRGNVAAVSAELAAAEAKAEAARLDAESEARVGQARVQATEGQLKAAKDNQDAAAEAYRLTRIGYEAGKTSLLELQSARRAVSEARVQSLDTLIERLGAEAALARLQGVAPFGDKP